jgi:hypothetical protein
MGTYDGMTTNERLWKANLLETFDNAAKKRNKDVMIETLKQVEFSESEAEKITDTIFKNPKMYGF